MAITVDRTVPLGGRRRREIELSSLARAPLRRRSDDLTIHFDNFR